MDCATKSSAKTVKCFSQTLKPLGLVLTGLSQEKLFDFCSALSALSQVWGSFILWLESFGVALAKFGYHAVRLMGSFSKFIRFQWVVGNG